MKKILTTEEAITISQKLKEQGKTIVLAGGCFDVLHIGHIDFVKEAKKQADFLFIFLESDETIQKLKGRDRPINSQIDRAKILAALSDTDYIIILPPFESNQDYDTLVKNIKPDIIATSQGDHLREHKERQAKLINSKVVDVIKHIDNKSTTKVLKLLSETDL